MSEMINKTAPEGNVPLYLFRSGKNSHSYEYMGCLLYTSDRSCDAKPLLHAERVFFVFFIGIFG